MNEEKDIRAAVDERVKEEGAEAQPESVINSQFIYDCLHNNERGDGVLFSAIFRGKFIFNKTSLKWLLWKGHHWELDFLDAAYSAVEQIAGLYEDEARKLYKEIENPDNAEKTNTKKKLKKLQDKLWARANKLRSNDGVKNCLMMAHRIDGGLAVRGDEFDKEPWLLACRNGVVDLRTGLFRDGRPEDLLLKAVPHDWQGLDAPAPEWEKFLDAVFDGDKEIVEYIQRLFGYGITGLTREHILPVLTGEGRNGKGTMVETISYVLGSLAQPIQSETLLEQKNARSSAAPSPDIMAFNGVRIAIASETEDGRKFSPQKAKLFTGGDTLTGRHPNDKFSTVFKPTHLLCLLTNHLPHAPADDFAFWERIHVIPFNMHFVDEPKTSKKNEKQKDKKLPEKLQLEAPGILAWLVKGTGAWKNKGGVCPPKSVFGATHKYQFNEDNLAQFIEDRCHKPEETPEDQVKFSDIYSAFIKWHEETVGDKKYAPAKRKFGMLMEKKFTKTKRGGTVYITGLALLNPIEQDEG